MQDSLPGTDATAEPESAPPAAADDLAACRELLRTGSRSFYTASMVLPTTVRI